MNGLKRPQSVFFISPEVLLQFQDLTRLPYLYDETVLECIVHRYKEDQIYTWAGPILVAVNPFRDIDGLYNKELIDEVFSSIKSGNDEQSPHVYSVAGLAHHRLVAQIGLVNQAILVSGESGAGKTESAKHLLTYLTQVELATPSSPLKGVWKGKQPRDVQRRILASNPILEAFGNAATARNYNSSRFGKLVRLQYSGSGLKGAEVDTYLLEKTRVTSQPNGERNFHIFYQLLSAVSNGAVTDLGDLCSTSFTIAPNYDRSRDSKDFEQFLETKKAFDRIGVDSQQQTQIFKMVAMLLHLGNIEFEFNSSTDAWIVARDEENLKTVSIVSEMLGLDQSDLTDVLTIKKIVVNTSGKETVFNKCCERRAQCEERRDALMQLLYSSLFAHLVATINTNTRVDSSLCSSYLGILDVYGFETFDENSLEQLCINYTNERLQQEFTKRYLASELRILSEEGFLDIPLIYTDNARCVAALDSPISVFSILNEECQLRRALNEASTCERVCKALEDTGVVLKPPSVTSGFIIKHYAGAVNYSSMGILHKNKDDVPKEISSVFCKTTNSFLSGLSFQEADEGASKLSSNGTPTRRLRKVTTLSKFKSSLDSLMKILTRCDLHYVRCLKPNVKSSPCAPHEQFLHDQLKSNGILETVKISQAGYPVRMLYKEFVKRYNFSKLKMEPKETAIKIGKRVLGTDKNGSPSSEKCRFGKTRIFLSENGLHLMEQIRTEQKRKAAVCIQKNFRRMKAMKEYEKILLLLVRLQRRVKTWFCVRRFKRIVKATIALQSAARGWKCVREFKKNKSAVVTIQRHVRGWLVRKKCVKIGPMSLRSSSRTSYGSAGYFSMTTLSSLTDNSISDAETISVSDDTLKFSVLEDRKRCQRLLETEESGLETDTESLSGERFNFGRNSKVRQRRQLESLSMQDSRLDISDEDTSSEIPFASNQSPPIRCYDNRRISISPTRTKLFPSREISANIRLQLQKKLEQPEDKGSELHSLRLATIKHFRRITSVLRDTTEGVQFSMPSHQLFFRDGIISYRQMPKVMIKFHTRRTCLPFSTCLPHQEKPQGLIDAIR